jgi:dihydrofolate synthase/folylpolyglutamate synthase
MQISPETAVIVERLNRLHPRVIDLSLGRMETLLAKLGNPERSIPPVIHIAGTNGKGSTLAFMRAICEAAGQTIHAYTSPHLVHFNERIRVAGRLISNAYLMQLIDDCEAANAGDPITFFEITTALAFKAFAETPADLTLLETGLGGRLDATNMIDRPVVTAITSISIDHVAFLGDTLAKIAFEKAGILKPGVCCVVAAQEKEALDVIAARASAIGAPLLIQDRDWSVEKRGDGMRVTTSRRTLDLPLPNLIGTHQLGNAAQAVATLDARDMDVLPPDSVARGLASADWPARMQRLTKGPLAALLPAGWELWLDGGHNPGAGLIVAEQMRRWSAMDPAMPIYMVFGILNSKDPDGFIQPLVPHVAKLAALTIPNEENSIGGDEAATVARRNGIDAIEVTSAEEAITRLAAERGPARILICGSLYLAGTILVENS